MILKLQDHETLLGGGGGEEWPVATLLISGDPAKLPWGICDSEEGRKGRPLWEIKRLHLDK